MLKYVVLLRTFDEAFITCSSFLFNFGETRIYVIEGVTGRSTKVVK